MLKAQFSVCVSMSKLPKKELKKRLLFFLQSVSEINAFQVLPRVQTLSNATEFENENP